jgi:hypothetical protein
VLLAELGCHGLLLRACKLWMRQQRNELIAKRNQV